MVKADILKIHQAGDQRKRRATRYTYNAGATCQKPHRT